MNPAVVCALVSLGPGTTVCVPSTAKKLEHFKPLSGNREIHYLLPSEGLWMLWYLDDTLDFLDESLEALAFGDAEDACNFQMRDDVKSELVLPDNWPTKTVHGREELLFPTTTVRVRVRVSDGRYTCESAVFMVPRPHDRYVYVGLTLETQRYDADRTDFDRLVESLKLPAPAARRTKRHPRRSPK